MSMKFVIHSNEYELFEAEVEVDAGEAVEVVAALTRVQFCCGSSHRILALVQSEIVLAFNESINYKYSVCKVG